MFITHLLQGQEPSHKIDLLLQLAKFTSQPVKYAVNLHLVQGYSPPMAQLAAGIKQQQLSRALKRLNEINHLVEEINNI